MDLNPLPNLPGYDAFGGLLTPQPQVGPTLENATQQAVSELPSGSVNARTQATPATVAPAAITPTVQPVTPTAQPVAPRALSAQAQADIASIDNRAKSWEDELAGLNEQALQMKIAKTTPPVPVAPTTPVLPELPANEKPSLLQLIGIALPAIFGNPMASSEALKSFDTSRKYQYEVSMDRYDKTKARALAGYDASLAQFKAQEDAYNNFAQADEQANSMAKWVVDTRTKTLGALLDSADADKKAIIEKDLNLQEMDYKDRALGSKEEQAAAALNAKISQSYTTMPLIRKLIDGRYESQSDKQSTLAAGEAYAKAIAATDPAMGQFVNTLVSSLKTSKEFNTAGGTYSQKEQEITIKIKALDAKIAKDRVDASYKAKNYQLAVQRLAITAQNSARSASNSNNSQFYKDAALTRTTANSLKSSLNSEDRSLADKESELGKMFTSANNRASFLQGDMASKAKSDAAGIKSELAAVASRRQVISSTRTSIDMQLAQLGGIKLPTTPATTPTSGDNRPRRGPAKNQGRDEGFEIVETKNGKVKTTKPATKPKTSTQDDGDSANSDLNGG